MFVTFLYLFVLAGASIGGLQLYLTFTAAESAPQEAAGAAMAVACAVIPYVFVRALQISYDSYNQLATRERAERRLASIDRTLKTILERQDGPPSVDAKRGG